MTGYYAADKGEALKLALEIIGEGSSVAMGCQSAHEIGLVDALQAGNYNYIDRSNMTPREDCWQHMMQMYFCRAPMR